jgi:hypothetical protein
MPDPVIPIDLYTPEALAACEKALRTVVAKVGAWGPRLILFGGLAPRYIVDAVPVGVAPHTGTTDLDVVIGVAIAGHDDTLYTKLQQELRNVGFEPNPDRSYEWQRRVDGIRVVMEFFCPVDEAGQPGKLKRNPGGSAGSKISAFQLKGAEIAGADCTLRTLTGEILDHGGRREVQIHVVNILPFLVLKTFALVTRDKEKDAYDIVWTLNAFGDQGPVSAAETAATSVIADHELVAEAVGLLGEHFSDIEAQGPSNYARFFLGGRNDAEDERARLRREAHGTVQEFLRRWNEVRSGG